jgi:hypothetical protein
MSTINYFIQSIAKSIEVKQQLLADEALIKNIADVTNQIIAAVKRGNRVIFADNGGSAAAYFHRLSPESMRKAKACALRDDGWLDRLLVAGQERVQCFSWHHVAVGLLRQLEQLGLVREGLLSQPSCPSRFS